LEFQHDRIMLGTIAPFEAFINAALSDFVVSVKVRAGVAYLPVSFARSATEKDHTEEQVFHGAAEGIATGAACEVV
jgi:hypothetical protein